MMFEPYNMVGTAHANGEVSLFVCPDSVRGTTLNEQHGSDWGASSVPTSPQGSVNLLRPRKLSIRAHRSSVVAAVGSGDSIVTASGLGTIRMWHAHELAREAEKNGLLGSSMQRACTASDNR